MAPLTDHLLLQIKLQAVDKFPRTLQDAPSTRCSYLLYRPHRFHRPPRLYLRTQRRLFVKRPPDEVAVLLGGDLALAVDADAAGVADHFADHVFGALVPAAAALLNGELGVGLAADRPLGDVVGPLVRVHAGRGVAEPAMSRQ